MKQKAVIFDIDGVLVEDSALLPYKEEKHNAEAPKLPITSLGDHLAKLCFRSRYHIIVLTHRPQKIYAETTSQLLGQGLFWGLTLIMRDDNDNRAPEVYKEEKLLELKERYDIAFAIDDNIKICKMYQKHGIPALQAYLP